MLFWVFNVIKQAPQNMPKRKRPQQDSTDTTITKIQDMRVSSTSYTFSNNQREVLIVWCQRSGSPVYPLGHYRNETQNEVDMWYIPGTRYDTKSTSSKTGTRYLVQGVAALRCTSYLCCCPWSLHHAWYVSHVYHALCFVSVMAKGYTGVRTAGSTLLVAPLEWLKTCTGTRVPGTRMLLQPRWARPYVRNGVFQSGLKIGLKKRDKLNDTPGIRLNGIGCTVRVVRKVCKAFYYWKLNYLERRATNCDMRPRHDAANAAMLGTFVDFKCFISWSHCSEQVRYSCSTVNALESSFVSSPTKTNIAYGTSCVSNYCDILILILF